MIQPRARCALARIVEKQEGSGLHRRCNCTAAMRPVNPRP
jgi:hypothetical protein